MTRPRTVFLCDSCGSETPKWEGRCPSCREWNTLIEVRQDKGAQPRPWVSREQAGVEELSQVSARDVPRLNVRSGEVNRVLGGGVVPGSLTVVAGDPGIGKSTMLLRLAADVAATTGPALYVSGEESAVQIRMRADRMGISGDGLFILAATALDEVMGELDRLRPALGVIDSIQTLHDSSLASTAGSVAQIKECTRALMEWAKSGGTPLVLSGHVTKGGEIAGPRVLEHMVDVVLYMEGDPVSSWRLLRGIKNRFGPTNEVGVFEMVEAGLVDVQDPSRAFLSERREGAVGSVVVPTLEGSRPLLVEVQALTNPSLLPAPRRVATGVDYNRLLMVCAVLSRRAGMSLANQDVLVNVTGGLRVAEPAADLGIVLAIASSLRNEAVAPGVAAIGEVGLSGEIRRVPQLQRRLTEVGRLGLAVCLVPDGSERASLQPGDLVVRPVKTVSEALRAAMPGSDRRTTGREP